MPSVDTGFVFALRDEAVGILDRMKRRKKTRGNDWTFYTGTIESKNKEMSIAVVMSGAGQNNAENATNVLLDVFAPKLICSAGYAGGLSSRLKQLTLCVPEQVIRPLLGRQTEVQALDLSSPIPRKTSPMSGKLTLFTANEVVDLPEQKRTLHEQTGAEIVDMETFAVAEVCSVREVPFLSIRVILDAVDDRIPKDVANLLDSVDSSFSRLTGTIFSSLVSRPSMVLDLVSLKRRAFKATERLADVVIAELSRRDNRSTGFGAPGN